MRPVNQDFVDQIVDKIVTITELPGGHGQVSQTLPEPIEIFSFKNVKVEDSLHRPEKVAYARKVSAREGILIAKSAEFRKSMVPRKPKCRGCKGALPSDRAHHCRKCKPTLVDDPGLYIYCGVTGE